MNENNGTGVITGCANPLTHSDQLNIYSKLRNVKRFIKNWSKSKKKELDDQMQKAEEEQTAADNEDKDDTVKQAIRTHLEGLYDKKLSNIRQKSRVNWETWGDRNSRFFHESVSRRRKTNQIHGIWSRGVWVNNPKEIKEAFSDYFDNFFRSSDRDPIFLVKQGLLSEISDLNRSILEAEFSDKEIDKAI